MDVEWLIHNLCFDETFNKAEIDIDLYDDDQWARLLQSFSRSKGQIEELEITRSTEYPTRSDDDIEHLFRVISTMSRLRELELSDFLASDLDTGLSYFPNFSGMEELVINLQEDDDSFMSTEFLQSIASMPKLSRISIFTPHGFAVSKLFSSSIEEVCVRAPDGMKWENGDFQLLCEDLQSNRFACLKSLELPYFEMEKWQIPFVANMLKENATLEDLSLPFLSFRFEDECCRALIDAMSHNKVLRSFYNNGWKWMARVVSSDTKEMQIQMLQRNTTLERFDLFDVDASRLKDLFLRLNKAGRKQLMNVGAGSVNVWIDVISHDEVRDDLSCVFYLLRMNPSLCLAHCPTQVEDSETTYGHRCDDNYEDTCRPQKRQCL